MTNLSNIRGFDLLRSFRKILYNFKKEEKDDGENILASIYKLDDDSKN